MRRYWLIFAQAVTVCMAILFVVTTLRPDWVRLSPSTPTKDPYSTAIPSGVSLSAVNGIPRVLTYAGAVSRAAPSVVNIYTSKHVEAPVVPLPGGTPFRPMLGQSLGFSAKQASTSLGSGVIVSDDGYLLTNYHVVAAAEAIEVSLVDGRLATARVVGADPDTDLAVLKLLENLKPLPVAVLAADRSLRVGDVVLAIGNPFGVGQTTTQGIVSALGRNGLGINTYENFIQTDAAINPGNSGGALVDANGDLVGINAAIYSETGGSLGIGFAIPIDTARKVMEEIIKTGAVQRGWLGIEPQDITPDLARAFRLPPDTQGVVVAGVIDGGPAAKGGLRIGDIVHTVNDVAVTDTMMMLRLIGALPPREKVELGIRRGGVAQKLSVAMGTKPLPPR